MIAWYKQGLEEAADKELLPELQQLETEANVPELLQTTPRRLRIAIIEEQLQDRKLAEALQALVTPFESNTQTEPPGRDTSLPTRKPGAAINTTPQEQSQDGKSDP
jgi:hypothetical protein